MEKKETFSMLKAAKYFLLVALVLLVLIIATYRYWHFVPGQ